MQYFLVFRSKLLWSCLMFAMFGFSLSAQEHQQPASTPTEQHTTPTPAAPSGHEDTAPATGEATPHAEGAHEEKAFDPGATALHHIADANSFHVFGDFYIPLPCFLYAPAKGWTISGSSNRFEPHHHGNGTKAIDGYVLKHGEVLRVADPTFPMGEVAIGEYSEKMEKVGEKEKEVSYVTYEGKEYALDKKSTWDGGLVGGGVTSFYDLSITKNVFTMILVFFLLFLLLRAAANGYKKREGQAPKGIQSFIEPLYTFIRDEVAKPMIGPKYERYMPYLLSAFFFILGLNLIGQIPFFPGSANVTGNISVTIVLAICTFLIVNLSGNKHYWEHTLWMPGVPAILKILILTPVEILGIFLKPFTLLLRLFANITAGHIVIISFVSLIFIFGKAGESVGGSTVGAAISVPLTLFMSAIELLVAFLQAFIFTMLSASYIGAAIEEPHHH